MPDWYPLSFDSTGTPLFPDQIDGPDGIASALTGQPDNPVTDLWILSYGWNTSVEGGDAFYKIWVDLLRSQIQQSNPPNAYPMFIGVYWPSEILADTNNKPNPAPATATRENFIQAYRPIFDPERKRSLPEAPALIGIVTSLQAAALRDMLRVLRTRYPLHMRLERR